MSLHLQDVLGKPEIVTYVMKSTRPKVKRPMYCVNCGGLLQFSYKRVAMVIQGVADSEEVLDEIKCKKCPQIIEIC